MNHIRNNYCNKGLLAATAAILSGCQCCKPPPTDPPTDPPTEPPSPQIYERVFENLPGMDADRQTARTYSLELGQAFVSDSITQVIFTIDTSNMNRGKQLCEQENQPEWCPDRLAVEDNDVRVDRWELLTAGDGSTRRNTIDLNEQRFYEPDGRNAAKFDVIAAAIADGHIQITVDPSQHDVHQTHSITVVVRYLE